METKRLESLKQIAAGIAAQFGDKCEVVIHDVSSSHPEHTIVHIENGHVSGRKVGDGASMVVLEQLEHQHEQPKDHLGYLTRTPDGKILKSSSLYIRNSRGAVTAIFSINYDVTGLMMMQQQLGELLSTRDKEQTEPEKIINVNDVLDELIPAVCGAGGQAGGADEQGRQGARHPVFEQRRRVPGDEVRRQGGKILRYFQIYLILLH